jgi:CYTH domain-containing protein
MSLNIFALEGIAERYCGKLCEPKGQKMKTEIERRFLVNFDYNVQSELIRSSALTHEITQGYLAASNSLVIRVRTQKCIKIREGNLPEPEAFLTIKGKSFGDKKASRTEFEYQIPVGEAEVLLNYCKDATVHKNRYSIHYHDHLYQIDEIKRTDPALVIAEVELESENEELKLPPWCSKEITGDERFSNYQIAIINKPASLQVIAALENLKHIAKNSGTKLEIVND